MLNPCNEINWHPDWRERRRFAARLLAGFPCLAAGLLLAQRWQGGAWVFGPALVLGGAGLALGLILWLVPAIARPFYVAWHAAACALGFVVANVVLAAVYLLLFAPVGIVRRAMGRPALTKGFDPHASTYWQDAPGPGPAGRHYRQF